MDDRLRAYLDHARQVIAKHGWMVQGVFPTEAVPGVPFAYTIGLSAAGLPELVIAGLPAENAAVILNAAARTHLTRQFQPGEVIGDAAQVPLFVIAAPHAEIQQARNLYGDEVSALQLVWPDENGHYPDEPGWTMPPDAQPLYGPRE
jgi:hypothetical protein